MSPYLPQAMEVYADITGDWHGVEILTDENGNRVVRGKCWDEYFWYPPACRDACHRNRSPKLQIGSKIP